MPKTALREIDLTRVNKPVPVGHSVSGPTDVENYLKRILGDSEVIERIRERISLVSACKGMPSVLISGESGTGKELVARAIHDLSDRNERRMTTVNCSAFPEGLFESELFGHRKGAFTGASASRAGLVEEACYSTLFLDEIGSIPLNLQVKLLRFLQDGEYRSVGNSRNSYANVRIIAATNISLDKLVREGSFREDLYYRLNTIPFHVPPVRNRKGDIPLLARHFISLYSSKYNKDRKIFSPGAMKHMMDYAWPGNVRELQNIIQRIVVICPSSTVETSDVVSAFNESGAELNTACVENIKVSKKKHENTYLVNLMESSGGNVARGAKMAGISRTALWNLLKKHQIDPAHYRAQA